jgi:hypothetical protein
VESQPCGIATLPRHRLGYAWTRAPDYPEDAVNYSEALTIGDIAALNAHGAESASSVAIHWVVS